jgi:hypothetical protein
MHATIPQRIISALILALVFGLGVFLAVAQDRLPDLAWRLCRPFLE